MRHTHKEKHTGKRADRSPDSDLGVALRQCFVVAAVLIDPVAGTATVTGRAAEILGLEPSGQVGRPLSGLPVQVREAVQEAVASGQSVEGREFELPGPIGLTRKIRLSVLRLGAGSGPAPVAVFLSDLSAAVELERKLRQLDRLATVGTLTASVAHELRNALVTARTFTDLLLEQHKDAELAGLAKREIERIDSIAGRMLRFSGPDRSAPSSIRLHETLDQALRLAQPRLEEKAIKVQRRFEATPARVQGDDIQLQQAFLNLFLNAVDAMPPNGTLTVTTHSAVLVPKSAPAGPAAPAIAIAIADTGPGIPAEDRGRLFEPFFTTKPGGTGLGLPMTRRIIHEHHGEISARSQPGKGAIFEIVLPAVPQAA